MRTVQMTLDDDLVASVDKLAKKLHTTRSALTRCALRDILSKANTRQLEHKHKQGYEQQPIKGNEFSMWEDEQKWGDA
jgi:metal-responsive CopG/Arc/MetJ family transcriptional regulator